MGEVVAAWAHIENYLTEIFAYLINAEGWVAAEIFENVRSPEAKIGIVKKYLNEKLQQLGPLIHDSLDPLLHLCKERNHVAHGRFIVRDKYPDGIVRVNGWGKGESHVLYDISTLDALVARMYEREQAVASLLMSVIAASPPRYETGRMITLRAQEFRAVGPVGNETLEFLQEDGTWLRPSRTAPDD